MEGELKYIDLALPHSATDLPRASHSSNGSHSHQHTHNHVERAKESATEYREIDFVKTQALSEVKRVKDKERKNDDLNWMPTSFCHCAIITFGGDGFFYLLKQSSQNSITNWKLLNFIIKNNNGWLFCIFFMSKFTLYYFWICGAYVKKKNHLLGLKPVSPLLVSFCWS